MTFGSYLVPTKNKQKKHLKQQDDSEGNTSKRKSKRNKNDYSVNRKNKHNYNMIEED